jgi:hypothetical protein
MVVLGGSCLVYIFLRRDKTVRVYKRQGSTEASPEPRESPETVSEEEGKGEGHHRTRSGAVGGVDCSRDEGYYTRIEGRLGCTSMRSTSPKTGLANG